MTTEDIYKDGYLDGMRYSGTLLIDVADDNLVLSDKLKREIQNDYDKRQYDELKRNLFIKRAVEDVNRLYKENEDLRKLLREANLLRVGHVENFTSGV